MYESIKKIVKESLNGYILPFHSDKIAEKVTRGLITAGAVIKKNGNEKN